MKVLTREEILEMLDIPKEKVAAWGGIVYVRGMTGEERDSFESSIIKQRGKEQSINLANVRAKLCALTICGADGKNLFSEADVQALGKKSAVELQKIFAVAQRLSGITNEDVEELSKGLKENPFEDSASGSQDTSDAR